MSNGLILDIVLCLLDLFENANRLLWPQIFVFLFIWCFEYMVVYLSTPDIARVMAACPCHSWWGWWFGTLWVTQGHDWTHFYSVYFVALNFFVEFPYNHTNNNKYSVTDRCSDWKGSTTVWNRRLWHCSTEDVHKFVNGFLQFFLVHLAGYTKTFQQLIKLLDPSVTKCTCSLDGFFRRRLSSLKLWDADMADNTYEVVIA